MTSITYTIDSGTATKVTLSPEGQSVQFLGEISSVWFKSELSSMKLKHPKAIIKVIDITDTPSVP